MNVLDLFSGIGGFSLGLERAGMQTVAFCEIEPFARRVLAKHWPSVPCYEDVRTLNADQLKADGISVDVICGGFPCQDISVAGSGAGIDGERSGLWREYARLIGELRPRYVIVENVAALLSRGLGRVLSDLAALGFDAEWHCIPASAIGAPHRRDRVWIVANPSSGRQNPQEEWEVQQSWGPEIIRAGKAMANASRAERHGRSGGAWWWCREPEQALRDARLRGRQEDDVWKPESELGRVAYGIPYSVERIGALGNAVVPQIPEIIGRAIMNSMKEAA